MIEVSYIDHMGNDDTIANAARTSFAKTAGTYTEEANTKLLNYLAKHKHFLPFRHPQVSLHIKAPIFIFRQLDKYQVGFSTSEISRRYIDSEPEMFMPDKWRKRAEAVKQGSSDEEVLTTNTGYPDTRSPTEAAKSLYEHALDVYDEMLYAGVAPEQARMILPQAMITEQYKTGSLLGWYHLVSQRKDSHAQKEIQEVAVMIEEIMERLFPRAWEALVSNG
jgi:thymidylate synthase (FAD)